MNRMHRDGCAGALSHLIDLEAPEFLYLGVDDEPAARREVLGVVAARLGSHKRCSSARLRRSGLRVRFPHSSGRVRGGESTAVVRM